MSLILALCVTIIQVTSHSCRSVPVSRTSLEDNTEELESNRNIADLLLPYLEQASIEKDSARNILEVVPYKNFDDNLKRRKTYWDDMKQLVELAPLRKKKQINERNPLAIILTASNIPELNPMKKNKRIKEQIEENLQVTKKRNGNADDEVNEESDDKKNKKDRKASDEKVNDYDSYGDQSVNQEDYNKFVAGVSKSSYDFDDFAKENTDKNARTGDKYNDNRSVLDEKESKYDTDIYLKEPERNEERRDESKNDSSGLSKTLDVSSSVDIDTTATHSKDARVSPDSSEGVTEKPVPVEEKTDVSKGNNVDFSLAGNTLNENEDSEPGNSGNIEDSVHAGRSNLNKNADRSANADDNDKKSVDSDVIENFDADDAKEKLISHILTEFNDSAENGKSDKCVVSRRSGNAEEKQTSQPHKYYTLSFSFNK